MIIMIPVRKSILAELGFEIDAEEMKRVRKRTPSKKKDEEEEGVFRKGLR